MCWPTEADGMVMEMSIAENMLLKSSFDKNGRTEGLLIKGNLMLILRTN